jgi:negative regulator of flagellin synthesis FlgM
MKIDNSSKSVGNLTGSAGSRAAAAGTAKTEGASGAQQAEQGSTVVSTTLHTIADTEPAFNSQRVAEIRQAISDGRFQINPEKIADGLINSVREMLAQNRRSA